MRKSQLKITAPCGGEVLVGSSGRDVGDVTDYLDDIDAFRELGVSGGRVEFDPRALSRTLSRTDPAKFMDGPVAEALRAAGEAVMRAVSGNRAKAYAEIVG